jgi:hypothetical protein
MLTFPLVIANIVSNSMEDYTGQWPAPTMHRNNAMPYRGHAPAQLLSQHAPVQAVSNAASSVENIAPAQSVPLLSGEYQFLGASSVLQEQPDLSRPPPSMLVEVNSTLIAATPAQSAAPNNRGNVKKKILSPKSNSTTLLSSSRTFFLQSATGQEYRCPLPPHPSFQI